MSDMYPDGATRKCLYACVDCDKLVERNVAYCPRCGHFNSVLPYHGVEASHSNLVVFPRGRVDRPMLPPGPHHPDDAARVRTTRLPRPVAEVPPTVVERVSTGFRTLDHVLGGGAVVGSVVLLGAHKGAGKSTVVTQAIANMCPKGSGRVGYYASGEEEEGRLALRARRCGVDLDKVAWYTTRTSIYEDVVEDARSLDAKVIAIDSLAVFRSDEGLTESEIVKELCLLCQAERRTAFVINHLTKDRNHAGLEATQHEADVSLSMVQRDGVVMIGCNEKNRFGPTDRSATLEMREDGLHDLQIDDEFDEGDDEDED